MRDALEAFGALNWFGMFLATWLIGCTTSVIAKLIYRLFRVVTVTVRGWPPAHLDADGDWKPLPKLRTVK